MKPGAKKVAQRLGARIYKPSYEFDGPTLSDEMDAQVYVERWLQIGGTGAEVLGGAGGYRAWAWMHGPEFWGPPDISRALELFVKMPPEKVLGKKFLAKAKKIGFTFAGPECVYDVETGQWMPGCGQLSLLRWRLLGRENW